MTIPLVACNSNTPLVSAVLVMPLTPETAPLSALMMLGMVCPLSRVGAARGKGVDGVSTGRGYGAARAALRAKITNDHDA